ncbi:MAG: hypothetical protein ACR2N9_03570 [Acidimicrobiia bacterium]
MKDTPLEPLVNGTKAATFHFAKAAFEVASGVGAIVVGVSRTVRPEPDTDEDETGPQHVTVE